MIEQIILGIIQGIAEWLPVSSEGLIVLVKTNFFGGATENFDALIQNVLSLHLGTFFAALIYFRRDIKILLGAIFHFSKCEKETQKLFLFLFIVTFISGVLGFLLIKMFSHVVENAASSTRSINLIVGLLLLVTASLNLKANKGGQREAKDLNGMDSLLLGLSQTLSVLPGLSRSGLTVSALLLRNFNKTQALRISFLMSLPIVLAGNIVLNLKDFLFNPEIAVGIIFAFIFGLATIHLFIKLAEKVNFGYFLVLFAFLMILSVFI
ncbi:MAG: undecaprenyl-diphosphate phosphatase [Candidatus Omnitrophota bacterium]